MKIKQNCLIIFEYEFLYFLFKYKNKNLSKFKINIGRGFDTYWGDTYFLLSFAYFNNEIEIKFHF